MSFPLVTVVVACYNHGPYIEECLTSILAQTYPRVELLVIDDGSSDDSAERIRRLQAAHGFDFLVQDNRGLTATLNAAFARARGEFLVPFGSDDVMLPERLRIQMDYMAVHPEVGICGGNMELMRSDGTLFPDREQSRDIPFRRLNFDDIFLERKPCVPAPTLLIRRQAFEAVGGFDPGIRLEDLYIQLKIARSGYAVDALNAVLARYRKHPSNSYRNIRFMTEAILRIYADYREHPEYRKVCDRLVNSMFVKAANRDKAFAADLLARLPMRRWNRRTLKGLLRYWFSPERR
ncbi:MAG: glycosyltransferase [Azonexus sp.]|nr:glycosyltransferase [Betaproteobacteria bacterium]MBK8917900.1 glycosyltransferase [Betaproteobacteria bacterium]MBP6037330.1 glycosyltransferase [Azonexus sp.]MBP6907943.1 glycosyltransferase [Azonexus sp.]